MGVEPPRREVISVDAPATARATSRERPREPSGCRPYSRGGAGTAAGAASAASGTTVVIVAPLP